MTFKKTLFVALSVAVMTGAPVAAAYAQPIFEKAREDAERRAENKAVMEAEHPTAAPKTQTAAAAPAPATQSAAPATDAAAAPAPAAPAAPAAAAPAPAPAK